MSALKAIKHRLFARFVLYTTLPAVLLFSTKFVSMIFLANFYNVKYTSYDGGIVFSNFQDFIFINNISNILSFIVIAAFTTWLCVKAYFLHHSHVSPKLSAWLNVQNLEYLLIGSTELYARSTAFVLFLWLTTFMVLGQAVLQIGSMWVFYTCFALSTLLSVLLVVDLERDHTILKELKKLEMI